jgi:uncharacterized membrane protein YeiB
VRRRRFRTASVMAFVALAAFDLAAIRTLGDYRSERGDLLLVGALPMANVLAVGMLTGLQDLRGRRFLLGFEAFGAMALAFYLLMAIFFSRVPYRYVLPLVDHLMRALGDYGTLVCVSAICSAAAAMLVLPQVAFGLIGGLLLRRFRNTVPPR